MNHEEIKNSIAAYCLGALDQEEKEELKRHLAEGCPECTALLNEMRGVTVGLPYTVPAQTPPSHVKETIFSKIQKQQRSTPAKAVSEAATAQRLEKSRRTWLRVSWGLSFAVIVLVIAFSWYITDLRQEIKTLQAHREMSAQLVKELQQELSKKETFIEVLQAPEARLVELKGLEAAPESQGKVIWDPEQNKAIFLASDLPSPPTDKVYQLWMLRGDQPVDAGVFTLDEAGFAEYTLDTIPDSQNLSGFAVTLEPKGGMPQPTGQMYLFGAVSKG